MDYKEAIEILHPDTTRKKLAEIEYYGGFEGQRKTIEAVNEACIVACEAMNELQLYKEGKLCLVPDVVYSKQCEELDEYKALGTVEEVREAVEKSKPQKITHPGCYDNEGVLHTWNGIDGEPYDLCPRCGINLCTDGYFGRDKNSLKFCENCGQALDWSEEK